MKPINFTLYLLKNLNLSSQIAIPNAESSYVEKPYSCYVLS